MWIGILEADLVVVFEPFFAEFEDLGEVFAEVHFGAAEGEVVQWLDGKAGVEREEIERLELVVGKEVSERLVVVFLRNLFGGEESDVVFGVGTFDLDSMSEVGGDAVGRDANPGVLVGGDEAD